MRMSRGTVEQINTHQIKRFLGQKESKLTLLDSDEEDGETEIKIHTSTSRYTRSVENVFLSQKKDTLRHMLHSNCISGSSSGGASSTHPRAGSRSNIKDGSEGHEKINKLNNRSSSKTRFQSMWQKYQEDYESDSSANERERTVSNDRLFSRGNGQKRTKLITIQNDDDDDEDDNSIR